MKILKFGGSSVADAQSIKRVAEIIRKIEDTKVIVVSALGGITDKLQECALKAEKGDDGYAEILSEISNRHLDLCKNLLSSGSRSNTTASVKEIFKKLQDICRGVFLIRELSPRSLDHILSFGEILSSQIINEYLHASGIESTRLNPLQLIKTDTHFGHAGVDFDTSRENIRTAVGKAKGVAVCAGFVATSVGDEHITTLGRGGSDYTAAIIAAALGADELQIWTDVNGMMTSDPTLVSNAHPIKELSYEEAMELSHFGAKVIFPPTIQPVMDAGIPVHIKNTFDSEDPGTRISVDGQTDTNAVKGLSSIESMTLITLSGSGMIAVPNISYRLFRSLSQKSVNVIMITQASSEHTITVGIATEDVEKAKKAVSDEFANEIERHKINPLEVETGLSVIALVGSNMKKQVGISAKLFDTLSHNGVNIRAIAQGSTELNITVVIDRKDLKKSLNSIHESFFLSDRKKLNLFMIGVGNVGQVLIEQVRKQQEYLAEAHNLELRIAGLANSSTMYFDEEGIDLDNWKELFRNKGNDMNLDAFMNTMQELNLRNSVFIDSTASAHIAATYQKVLEHSISVVTPNKIACSSDYDQYQKLTDSALKYKAKFLFETNVGAGLPIISTLNDLIKSGDKVFKIQAVLSGTLNYIFNNYDGSQPFSTIVKDAKKAGYTEPDPREDLSGVDVMRKILILARESGYKLEMEDIRNRSFIPEECMNTDSLDEFYRSLDDHEERFKALAEEASNQGKRLKYVASFEEGEAETGLKAFGQSHPFYELGGKDNIVLFYTSRYKEQPLVVKGAGAGAAVTASGIFADIMKIASA